DFHVTGVQTCALPISITIKFSASLYTHWLPTGGFSKSRLVSIHFLRLKGEAMGIIRCFGLESLTVDCLPLTVNGQPSTVNGKRRSEERRVGEACRRRG